MSSARQIIANRGNARTSTGPRTAKGKARSAQNARRHGLCAALSSDPILSPAVEELAQTIAGDQASTNQKELARRIAEAQIVIVRVRQLRRDLLAGQLADTEYIPARERDKCIANLGQVSNLMQRELPIPEELMLQLSYEAAKKEGAEKIASILLDHVVQLSAFERYERRALSRRKFAIRAFDAACDARGCGSSMGLRKPPKAKARK